MHSSTSFTPNEIVFNQRNIVNPNQIAEEAKDVYAKVLNQLKKSATTMTKNNSMKEDPPTFIENTDIQIKKNTRKKLDPRFSEAKCLKDNKYSVVINRNVKRNKNKLKRTRKP